MSDRGGRGRRGGRGEKNGRGGGRGHDRGRSRGRGHGRGGNPPGRPNSGEQNTHETAPTRVQETEEQRQVRKTYGSWRRLVSEPVDNPSVRRRLWEGALSILEAGDRDWRQQLPQDLNNKEETGHAHILALLSTKVSGTDYETFISNGRNFLLTITHTSLLRCLAVDTHVGLIYNLFGGVNGKRAVSFLQRLLGAMLAAGTAGTIEHSTEDNTKTLLAVSNALFELLKREPRARFNDEIPELVDSIQTATALFKDSTSLDLTTRTLSRLNEVRALIARAQGLLAKEIVGDNATDNEENASFYPRDLIVPCNRFDNDKKDIAEMTIFPTRDEIMSDVKVFLPYTDPDQPHFLNDPVQRHIDTFFRLFRHDIFDELKGALAGIMHAVTQDPKVLLNPKLNIGDIRAYHYVNARVSYVMLDTRKGLQVQVEFLQPEPVLKKTSKEKEQWWEDSRRFDHGSLLSLMWLHDSDVQLLFLTVSEKTTDPKEKHGLTHDQKMACITASLVMQDRVTVKNLMQAHVGGARGLLLEFPKVIPATFSPILESLQGMQRLNRLPFQQWIVPPKNKGPLETQEMLQIPPPLYARSAGFKFSLLPLLEAEDRKQPFSIDTSSSCDDEVLLHKLETRTQLDRGQCQALVAALTREYAFIQGPPGTGKSYLGLQIMKVLLDIQQKAKLGPILIVCYTNHALDQFLEHLLEIGVKKLIRVGGMSKSKKLENHNLRFVSNQESKTKSERYMAAANYTKLDNKQKESKSTLASLNALRKQCEWRILKSHISEEHPRIYSQFRRFDEQGFEIAGRHPFDVWKSGIERYFTPPPANLLDQILQKANKDVYSLTIHERGALMAHWIEAARSNAISEFCEIVKDAAETQRELNNIHEELNRRVLEEAHVIGVTTTGLAKRISVLQQVKCNVIICEEAGEVMESHMISALLPEVTHVIQIGDHQQLRPSVNNFKDLSLESERGKLHQLDRSQFERLCVGQPGRPLMPVAQLNVQRRMRPQISSLIRETIYKKLQDHPSTTNLPDVIGMRHNIFWFDHRKFEDQDANNSHITKSKSNSWEVQMVHALVRHIVRQGIYRPDDIAVLTPYTGQLQKLRATMRREFEVYLSDRDREALENDGFAVEDDTSEEGGSPKSRAANGEILEKKKLSELLRIATVDNFQGEEAKIVIISLVRSNDKQKVGFLKTTNRINVLLSRAKHGMYLIGNAETYIRIEMWQKVIAMLQAAGCFGTKFALSCPRHPATPIEVQEPDEFHKYSPEGGCMQACIDRLDCGHRCGARCHSKPMHLAFRCEQPCQRRHQPCNHPCQKATCGEPCGKCIVRLDNIQLPCGHFKYSVPCHLTQDIASIACDAKVSKRMPGCGHDVIVKCSSDVSEGSFKCSTPCKSLLPCGHPCPGTCGRCNSKDIHGQPQVKHSTCQKPCGRKYGACNHNCPRICHDGTDCGMCQSQCEVRCKHTRCAKKCHEPCTPCTEPCQWSCEHQGDCKMPCSAPCDRLPCDERCARLLPCGHQCPSVCGEDCPMEYCQQCGTKSEEQPDMIMMSCYADIDLNETPIVVLGCGHFFTTETLDGLVGLKDVYQVDKKSGRFLGLIENAELSAKIPQCPNCREPIRQYVTQRYNRLINRAVIDEMSKRFIVSGQRELQSLDARLDTERTNLEASRATAIPTSSILAKNTVSGELKTLYINGILKERHSSMIRLLKVVKSFRQRVDIQHQPAYKLYQAIMHSIAKNTALDTKLSNLTLDPSSPSLDCDRDQRVTLGGNLLEIKVRYLELEDRFELMRAVKLEHMNRAISFSLGGISPETKTRQFLGDCEKLISKCMLGRLPKLAVEASLYYAQVAQMFTSLGIAKDADRTQAISYRSTAKRLLTEARELCKHPFRGRDALLQAIVALEEMLNKEFYEEVSMEEIEAIKAAMVSGPGGIATHSGHWYNCVNGHPFAIGECGMPMEQARCPECGEAVGGQNHTAVPGVSRAMEME